MPPRKTRAAKKEEDAVEQAPLAESSSATALEEASPREAPSSSSAPPSKPKAKARAARHQPLLPEEPPAASTSAPSPEPQPQPGASPPPSTSKPTMEDRQARLSALRAKMSASTRANRNAILADQSRTRTLSSNTPGSRKLAKAATLLEERDLTESGVDVERHRNLHYSLEESEKWDAKLEEKEKRKDQGVGDFGDAAEKAYQRQIRALSEAKGASAQGAKPASGANGEKGKGGRGEDTGVEEVHYGSHKPSDSAIDRVVSHLNREKQIIQSRSRRRAEEDGGQVDYINDGNKHFNKKLKRFYDKQTKEIRENLERGTAL